MKVSVTITNEQMRDALRLGIYTIIPSNEADEASDNSLECHYHLVEYTSDDLYQKRFFVKTI